MDAEKIIKVSKIAFINSLKKLASEYKVYVPVINQDQKKEMALIDEDASDPSVIELNGIRPATNLKSFFFESHSKVAEYPGQKESSENIEKRILVGVKSCDLYSIRILDRLFLDSEYPEYNDIFYKKLRENTLIIASDCDNVKETCSCKLMGVDPFLTDAGKDDKVIMNLSQSGDEVIIEFFSDVISPDTFDETENANIEELKSERDAVRKETEDHLKSNLSKYNINYNSYQDLLKEKRLDKKWNEVSKNCVECHGCLNGCPTCHCYLLIDMEKEKDKYERYRVWDTCYYRGYSTMAGGLSPRPDFIKRFQNRFYHKYDWSMTNIGIPGCSGCGRCIETCMGKIDFREVFEKLNG